MKYGREYYTTNNYIGYLERGDRYERMAAEIGERLTSLGIIDRRSTILDYGCGTGMLLDGLRDNGFKNIYGYEISEYAKYEIWTKGYLSTIMSEWYYDLGIFLDVLEHMQDSEICDVFGKNYTFDNILVRIPCAKEGENNFFLEVSKQDPTHINCKDKKGWIELFNKLGYQLLTTIKFYTIYDSEGVFCAIFKKKIDESNERKCDCQCSH